MSGTPKARGRGDLTVEKHRLGAGAGGEGDALHEQLVVEEPDEAQQGLHVGLLAVLQPLQGVRPRVLGGTPPRAPHRPGVPHRVHRLGPVWDA